jgi:polysaccharide biosynthesis transport protein
MSGSENSGLTGYLAILRRRKIYLAIIPPLFILAAIYLSFSITPLYESSAAILLEPSSVDPKVVTTTVISYSSEQIEIVQGRVMTTDILKDLVKSFDPYPQLQLTTFEKAERVVQDTTVERIDPVTLKPLQESNAFMLHYRNPDKERAVLMAGKLAQLFLDYNKKSREEAATGATGFLKKQAEGVSEQMRQLDDEIKTFKAQHGDALPEFIARNEAAIDRLQHDLDTVQQEVLRSSAQESLLATQLSQTSPNVVSSSGDLTDLPAMRAKLAEAQERYTPDHPEVKRLKAAVALLSSQQGQGTGTGIVANANNPTYLTIASQLQSARNEVAGLKAQAARDRQQIDQYEAMLRKTPGVEREYAEITRRRQALQTTYEQIQDKLQNAQIAQNFETQQGGERFTLIRAPFAGRLPVYPNRIGLILLGFVLGSALAGIAIAIAENGDSRIRSASDFPLFPDAQLLASIPRIDNNADRRRHRFVFISWVAAYGVAIFVVGATVVAALNR